jgi:recombination protein RecA
VAKPSSPKEEGPPLTEEQALDALLKRAAVIDGGASTGSAVEAVPSGISSFDSSTGIGGFPRGRISILQGEEHSGKTLLALTTIAQAQKRGERCFFIDAEHALTPGFARLLGCDWDALAPFVRRPQTLDQAYDLIKDFSRSGLFGVGAFDSTTALTTNDAIDLPAGSQQGRAAVARMHSEELPKVVAKQHPQTALLFINQMRENPNPPNWWRGGKLLYTPGGKALKHASSLTVLVKAGEVYKQGDVRVGHQLKTKLEKNKVGTPFTTAEFDLMYADGLDLTTDLIDTAQALEIITLRGSNYYIQVFDEDGVDLGEKRYQGKKALEDAVRTDDFIREFIQRCVAAVQQAND